MAIILKRGLEANRSSTAVAEGELLFSKDTGRLYIGSGSGNLGGQEIKFNELSASATSIQNTDVISRVSVVSVGSVGNAASIFVSKVAGGTLSAPSATQDGHYSAIQMQTYGGSTWSTTARMLMQTAGSHLEDSRPTNIIFSTVVSGSSTLSDRFKINGLGVQVTGSLGVAGNANIVGSITASLVSATTVSASNLYAESATLNVTTMSVVNITVSGILSASLINSSGPISATSYIKPVSAVVGSLVDAATAGPGALANVTDATTTVRYDVVTGSGAINVMVFSNGTNWLIL